MRIGLVLPTTPNYSETFFQSQILGLSQSGFDVILYLNSNGIEKNTLPENVNIIAQSDFNNWIKLVIFLLQAAIFELLYRPQTSVKIIINEFMNRLPISFY